MSDDGSWVLSRLATYRYLAEKFDNNIRITFFNMVILNELLMKHQEEENINEVLQKNEILLIFSRNDKDNPEQLYDREFINMQDPYFKGEIMLLIELCNAEYIKNTLDLVNEFNLKDEEGRIPLHYLSIRKLNDTKSLCKWMLEKGARINEADSLGKTPLHCAVEEGNINLVRYLLKRKAAINIQDSAGNTPLDYAVNKKNEHLITLLLSLSSNS